MYAEIKRFNKTEKVEIPVWTNIKIVDEYDGIEYIGNLYIVYKEKEIRVDIGHKMSENERREVLIEIYNKLIYFGNIDFAEFKLNDLNNREKYNKLSIIDELYKRLNISSNYNSEIELILNEVRDSFKIVENNLNMR